MCFLELTIARTLITKKSHENRSRENAGGIAGFE